MDISWLRRAAVVTMLIGGWLYFSDPHRTRLPFGTTDLSSVVKQLEKLPVEEHMLVEAYVRRSNGDVLPEKFADPDDPLTARTFGEAIELQRAWEVKMKAQQAREDQLKAERDAKLAPLRAVVLAEVVGAQVMAKSELARQQQPVLSRPATAVATGNDPQIFVLHVRLHNLGAQTVLGLTGSLKARDHNAWLPMDLCWMELGSERAIQPDQPLDLYCSSRFAASQQERDFAANPQSGRFEVYWEPKTIRLASGELLKSGL